MQESVLPDAYVFDKCLVTNYLSFTCYDVTKTVLNSQNENCKRYALLGRASHNVCSTQQRPMYVICILPVEIKYEWYITHKIYSKMINQISKKSICKMT